MKLNYNFKTKTVNSQNMVNLLKKNTYFELKV